MRPVPKVLFHKVLGGYGHELEKDIRVAIDAIMLEGLIPKAAEEYRLLIPAIIRDLPIVWLSEKMIPHSFDVLEIETSRLDSTKLHRLDVSDVDWWVYTDIISSNALQKTD